MIHALLLLLPLSLAPAAHVPAADELSELVAQLELRRDDADEALVLQVAELGTREALMALLEFYEQVHSVFMKREIVRALSRFDGVQDAEQPALQKLMDVAVGAREQELREAAVEGLGECRNLGRDFLRMIASYPADEAVRERALELHLKRAGEADLPWYRELFGAPPVVEDPKDRGRRKKPGRKQDASQALQQPIAAPEALRLLVFPVLVDSMEDAELLHLSAEDRSLEIRAVALHALNGRGHAALEEIATELLDAIGSPPEVRIAAAEVLADLRGAEIADHFITLAKKQEVTPERLRRRMAELLAAMEDPKVDGKTWKLLGRGKPHQRTFALRASRNSNNSKLVGKLTGGLRDKDPEVSILAIEIIAERGFTQAVPHLTKELQRAERKESAQLPALVMALTRLRAEDPEWRAELVRFATGDSRGLRNAALRALAQSGGEEHLDTFVAALDHADWSTRHMALRGLEQLRSPASVEAIIARMAEERGRMLNECANALWRLTGQPFRKQPAAWRGWWRDNHSTWEPIPAESLAELEREEEKRRLRQLTRVEFFGIRIESTRVIFVIDVSGSMAARLHSRYVRGGGQTRIDVAKEELKRAIDALDAATLYNILPFSSGVMSWLDGVAGATEHTREEAHEYVERLGAGGGTNLYEAIEVAFDDPDVDTIVILSDGEPSVGPVIQPGRIREAVRRWNEHRGIKVHCIAVGGSLKVLEWIAEDSGGDYVRFQ